MSQFRSLITVSPLGLMYGSAGGFLSPENLVGRANTKFPPDAATVAGLLLNANREQRFIDPQQLKRDLVVAGPFWANQDAPTEFYVPIPWHKIIGKDDSDEWELVKKLRETQEPATSKDQWLLNQYQWQRHNQKVDPAYSWQLIDDWDVPTDELREREQAIAEVPWKYTPFLHPKIKPDERHVVDKDGLFLENAVQLHEDTCLVYLTNIAHSDLDAFAGWYRLGGEGHLVEIESCELTATHKINRLLNQKVHHAFALITPGVWGSNKLSYRYPQAASFPNRDLKLLTDRATPYRYRVGKSHKEQSEGSDRYNPTSTGRLSRGRYAVPAGSVYVFREPLEMSWWEFPEEWFPKEGFPLKHLGCGLCLPISLKGVPECTAKLTA
ncbi:type III-B CRISPR module-associated Cmr3 family protein [Alkalinema pantanalense CENA528]|uniref:type III-B CRISPR module-associated Cmr3 family protein n=1 Tax=Alkalinema pantanalense TaxID=1620705 RepID=UPI003D6E067C